MKSTTSSSTLRDPLLASPQPLSTRQSSTASSTTTTPTKLTRGTSSLTSPLKNTPLKFETEPLPDKSTPNRGLTSLYIEFADKWDMAMIVIGIIAAAGNGAMQPVQSIIMGNIFGGQAGMNNEALEHQIKDNIHWMVTLAFMSLVLNYLQYACFMSSSERIIYRLKHACLSTLLKQEVGFFDENPHSALSARVADQSFYVNRGISDTMGSAIQFVSQFISGFIISFSNNAKVAGVMLLAMPLISIFLSGLIYFIVKVTKTTTQAYEEASTVADESLSGVQTVASFNGEQRASKAYDMKLDAAEKSGIRLAWVRGIGLGAIFSSVFFTFGAGYLYGAHLIANGGEDFGGVLTSVFSAVLGSVSIGMAAPAIGAISQARMGCVILFKIIDRVPKIDAAAPGKTLPEGGRIIGLIEFKDVVFGYPTRPIPLALNGVSFTVKPGQIAALVGASGSGKSTIVALLQRWYDVNSGVVSIDGVDVRDYQLAWLRNQCGVIPQEPILWDTSIGDNIRMGSPKATMEQVMEAAKLADADEFIAALPHGYLTRVGAGGSHLSGGQKQRVAIARALVRNPSILICDEATSALDEKAQRSVQASIDKVLHRGTGHSSIVIAHRLSTIMHSHVIIVFDNPDGQGGRVVEIGTHTELLRREGVYYNLVKAQADSQGRGGGPHDVATPPPPTLSDHHDEEDDGAGDDDDHDGHITATGSHALDAVMSSMSGTLHSSPRLLRGSLVAPMSASRRSTSVASAASKESDFLFKPPPPSHLVDKPIVRSVFRRYWDQILGGETEEEMLAAGEELYPVPLSRVWAMSKPEAWWYVLGVIGSAIKGSSQPMMSLIITHIMTHMILIPAKLEGVSEWPCKVDADCGVYHPVCIHMSDIMPGGGGGISGSGVCAKMCTSNHDCASPGSTCYSLSMVGINGGLCVPHGGWREGNTPQDVRHTGVVAFELYAFMALISAMGMGVQQISFGMIGERLTKRLRSLTFTSMLRQDATFFDDEKNKVGGLLSRLSTDAALVQSVTTEYMGLFLENAVSILCACTIAFVASWRMASVLIACAPMMVFATWWQQRTMMGKNKANVKLLQSSASVLSEALGNVRTVYSFNAEAKIVRLYDEALDLPKSSGLKAAQVAGIGSGVAQAMFFSMYAIGFSWGAHLLAQQLIQARQLSRSFFAITMSSTAVGQTFARAGEYGKAKVATSNIFKLADAKPKIDIRGGTGRVLALDAFAREPDKAIKFHAVSFKYPTRPDLLILDKVDFEIPYGATVSFCGASGCGKSTIIRLLLRFYDCEDDFDSRISIAGVDLRDLDLKWWRSQVGYVSQEPILFRGSVRYNLEWAAPSNGSGINDARIWEALDAANATEFVSQMTKKLDTQVGVKGSMLSGGQRQRLCIARALLKDPLLMCLDEATSALDSESEKVVQAALDKLIHESRAAGSATNTNNKSGVGLRKRRTTVIVAHRLASIINSDMIFVLANPGTGKPGSKIVENGTHDELIGKEGLYRAFYGTTSG